MKAVAPAKVNLALHVTGKREDGYHLLDSLVVFAGVGDILHFAPAAEVSLRVTGPFADGVPTDRHNLIWQAAEVLDSTRGVTITLEKHLPHPAGIGGGSSDAAATLRALTTLWDVPPPAPETVLALGADVPVCLSAVPARMSGIGEALEPVPPLPPLWLVLVNPGIDLPTGRVFAALESVDNAPMAPPAWEDVDSFLTWLSTTRNDLEAPARTVAPVIDDVLTALAGTAGCHLARMSGSGATCFGLFTDPDAAARAPRGIARPGWWVKATEVARDAVR